MNLTIAQIRELIKSPKNGTHIQAAKRDNLWQSFHAKPSTDKSEVLHYNNFVSKVGNILNNKKKLNLFEKILSFPLPSTQIVSKASDEWNKIFNAQDRTIEYYFEDESLQGDFREYLDKINIQDIVEQNIFTAAKQSINTFVVVDFPSEMVEEINEDVVEPGIGTITDMSGLVHGETNYVSPFVYLLDAEYVVDADEDESGNIEYIIFIAGSGENKKYVAIDDTHFRMFVDPDDEEPTESAHNLGFCPVRTIWSDNIANDVPIRRFNSVIEALSELDEYVQYHVFSRHTHLYAGFPIVSRYVSQCNYVDVDNNPCNGGIINIPDPLGGNNHRTVDCPVCSKQSGLFGPGSMATIPMPKDKDAPPMPDAPVSFITPSVTILDYNKNVVKEKEARIALMLTGGQLKVTDNDAINEDQVRSQYETKQDILVNWAENIQKTHKFIVDTIGKARYGDLYKGSTVNYGYNFFLIDMNIAVKEYTDAVDAGLPQYLIAEKRSAVEAIYVRRSPERAERVQLLRMLEPFLDINIDKIPKDSIEYALKSNFSKYIDTFEARFGPITLIGANEGVTLIDRIEKIKQQLYIYVKEDAKKRQEFLREFGQGSEVSAVGINAQRSGGSPNQNNQGRGQES